MTSLFMVRQLAPWFENISKRQVRSPKVYVADSGILYSLLGLPSRDAVVSHPKVGASWEGFVVSQVIERLAARPKQCFHWSTHSGAESSGRPPVARLVRCWYSRRRRSGLAATWSQTMHNRCR